MSVFNPNDPNKTLIPQTGNRQTPYNIGGKPPYGFVGTPAYNPAWNPGVPQSFVGPPVPGTEEVALYERFDWDKSIDARQYQNPAFVGIGSTGKVPQWMQGDGGAVKRILRGYMRRSTVYPLSQPGLSDQQKATNAKLYFMYNPSDVARQYVSYSVLAGQSSDNPDSAVNGGQQVPALVTMNMELLFDRQEEVARFPNHPGVLVDLAVFDMLIGNNVTSYDDVMKRDIDFGNAGATTAVSTPSAGADTTTLKPGLDIYITIIMSPSLVFEGKIMEASALFQKFSHRMTPTRMTLSVTLLLNYTGKLIPATTVNAADQAQAAWRRDLTANKETVNPAVKAGTRGAALNLNFEGRQLAVEWGSQWTAEAGKRVNTTGPYAGTTGSYYWNSKKNGVTYDRCANWQNDDLVLSSTDPARTPPYFDCSSFCWRCFNVIGWADALHLGTTCAPGSDFFIQTALDHTDVWSALQLDNSRGALDERTKDTLARNFNIWDPENTGQPGPNVGDMIVRQGQGASGHIGFIHSKISGDASNHRGWQWKVLHSCCPDEPVKYGTYTTDQIIFGGGNRPYTYIIRPHPIKS
jgi:hypothetical protein